MSIAVESGFKVATRTNIPTVTEEMVFSYITKLAQTEEASATETPIVNYIVDCVQVRRRDLCLLKGRICCTDSEEQVKYNVALLVNERQSEVVSAVCEDCSDKNYCLHGIAFLFWTYRKNAEYTDSSEMEFWGADSEKLPEPIPMRIKDIYPDDLANMDAEDNETGIENNGEDFLNNVLDEMSKNNLTNSSFYRHCRPVVEEFEPVYIHHTMLAVTHYKVKNYKTFLFHMEGVSRKGLFDSVQEASINNYKERLWMETQYCRVRCSLIHKIVSRKDPTEDEDILNSIFGTDRESNIENRKKLKKEKRLTLKQTEKLHNKPYKECGLLLSAPYPYLCGSPDGICEDYIVEIKAPKTTDEFEKYMQGKEIVGPKYMAQIQIQMFLANVSKALYCVLSPNFETSGSLHYVWVEANMPQVYSMISAVEDYWKNIVFPRIQSIYVDDI